MFIIRQIRGFLLVLISLSLFAAPAFAGPDPEQAQSLIETTAAKMQKVLLANRAELDRDSSKIYDYVHEIMLPTIDFDIISKLVLGAHWRRASAQQRQRFTSEFRNLMVRTYAKALLQYVDADIAYLPLKRSKRDNRVTVSSAVNADGRRIPLDYTVCHDGSRWRVCNIVIDKSINFVVTYRQQIGDMIQRDGLDQVIDELTRRNSKSIG